MFFVILGLGAAWAYAQWPAPLASVAWLFAAAFPLALIVSRSIRVAAPWDRAVVLRLGRFRALRRWGAISVAVGTMPTRGDYALMLRRVVYYVPPTLTPEKGRAREASRTCPFLK